MEEVSLKVLIAGRIYPLTVKKEDEKKVLNAVEQIDLKLKDYSDNYSVRDKQDLLAMCALHFVNQNIELESVKLNDELESVQKLKELNDLLDECLI